MQHNQNIPSAELDQWARNGMDALHRVMVDPEPSDEDRTKARMVLLLISQGTRRMSAETNRAAVAYKIAKENGIVTTVVEPVLKTLLPEMQPVNLLPEREAEPSSKKKRN